MATKQHREARAAVKAWCKKRKIKLVGDVRHVHPRCYVIGRAAPLCLIVAECWADSEPHMRKFDNDNPLSTVHTFDESLKAGDWCVCAYISTAGAGQRVAIALPEAA